MKKNILRAPENAGFQPISSSWKQQQQHSNNNNQQQQQQGFKISKNHEPNYLTAI